jgi:DNA repair exonuclease SbcCD ATPase subunit
MSAAEAARNLYPVPQTPDLMDKVTPVVEEAMALQVVTKSDVDTARSKGKIINALISEVEATFKPIKQAQDAAKKITLDQEKKHLAPLQQAKSIIAGKITAWDEAERKRIEEEQRLAAQEAERKRQLALKNAQDKLDKLTQNLASDQEKLAILESRLTDPTISDEEAEVVRANIRTVQAKISTTMERTADVEMKVEEASAPIAPTMSAHDVKTATGVGQEKVITAINTRALIRYLASDQCPFDPEQFIDWKQGTLKKQIQTANLPGVSWKWQAKTRF